MKIISHRGNITGPSPAMENGPEYLKKAISLGYDVEADVWFRDGKLWLGHDGPKHELTQKDFRQMLPNLWIHCKNAEAIEYLSQIDEKPNFFWHQDDDYTLTSKGFVWTYPHMQPIHRSVAVMPEIFNVRKVDLEKFWGVCTDYCIEYGGPSQPLNSSQSTS